jgi:cobalt/nickel transport system permease protein
MGYIPLFLIMIPIWLYASYRLNKELRSKQVPLLALAAAFSFVIMMFNIPMPGGTSGHMVGAALISIILGPWASVVAMTVTLAIQAFVMRDGGITALGANCFTMAFLMPVSAYITYKIISGRSGATSLQRLIAAAIAGFVSLVIGGTATGFILGSQYPQFFPYSFNVSLPAMLIDSLFFGIFEAVVTGLIFAYIQRNDPSLIAGRAKVPAAVAQKQNSKLVRNLLIGLAALVVLTPVGLYASGVPFGEWSLEELQQEAGYLPSGISAGAGDLFNTPLSDYGIPGLSAPVGYVISAIVGVALCGGLLYLAMRWAKKKEKAEE